ncbi:hypothetical protein [Pseudoflavitalea rhizosphaerae]|uniref:hypothetical protein n=1 Tax=Pseudoflavitalea rhizosphaerae TaxID=1884793 RepID=UPI000F8DC100|nr:hypothetical protein [Pseudoflavitalea rhizosphaerae]
MNKEQQSNFEFIYNNIFNQNLGIDIDGLDMLIKENIMKNPIEWSLSIDDTIRGKKVNAEYTFSKSETNPDDPKYYFSKAKGITLAQDGTIEVEQEFKVISQRFVNMEKMLGLLNGNPVSYDYFKKGENKPYEGYLQLDAVGELKLYANSTTNFNLIRKLSEIPLHKMTQQQKEKMIHDVNHGFPPTVEVKMPDGSIQKAKLEIHPKIGAVLAKDMEGNRLRFSEGMQVLSSGPKINPVSESPKKEETKVTPATQALINKADSKKNNPQKETKPGKKVS